MLLKRYYIPSFHVNVIIELHPKLVSERCPRTKMLMLVQIYKLIKSIQVLRFNIFACHKYNHDPATISTKFQAI